MKWIIVNEEFYNIVWLSAWRDAGVEEVNVKDEKYMVQTIIKGRERGVNDGRWLWKLNV